MTERELIELEDAEMIDLGVASVETEGNDSSETEDPGNKNQF